MVMKRQSRLARIISIKSPNAFRQSIRAVKRGGVSTRESRALQFAQNRAVAMLGRKHLSMKERGQMRKIGMMRIPKPNKR